MGQQATKFLEWVAGILATGMVLRFIFVKLKLNIMLTKSDKRVAKNKVTHNRAGGDIAGGDIHKN